MSWPRTKAGALVVKEMLGMVGQVLRVHVRPVHRCMPSVDSFNPGAVRGATAVEEGKQDKARLGGK